jgi:hypothetical protein
VQEAPLRALSSPFLYGHTVGIQQFRTVTYPNWSYSQPVNRVLKVNWLVSQLSFVKVID